MSEECPECDWILDHREPQEWHGMSVGDALNILCPECGHPLEITADIAWDVGTDEERLEEMRDEPYCPTCPAENSQDCKCLPIAENE